MKIGFKMQRGLSFSIVAILLTCLSLVSCGPRGETRTLDEVLSLARDRFARVRAAAQVPPSVSEALNKASSQLDKMVEGDVPVAADDLHSVAGLLELLGDHAGYTVRPAMAELMNQYRSLGDHLSGTAVDGLRSQVRLLAARTYSNLASELETTAFGVTP